MSSIEIREATADDWPAIWPFLREIVAAGETYTLPRDITEDAARDMWMTQPEHTAVAVDADDGRVVGSAKMGANHSGPAAHVASASYMVDPAQGRRGVGRALGEYSIEWATAQGFRAMQFNAVVETNVGAVALWRSLGFELIGTLPEGFLPPQRGLRGTAHHAPAPGGIPGVLRAALLRGEQVDHEHERLVGLDVRRLALRPVGEVARDRELAPPAHLHALQALVPAGDHVAGAELELERLPVPKLVSNSLPVE